MNQSDNAILGNLLRRQVQEFIFSAYTDQKGVHAESVLVALGALAGFAVQEGLREAAVVQGGKHESSIFTIVEAKSGEKYFFGEVFDQFLLGVKEGHISVWSLVGGGAQRAGATCLPDIEELVRRNAALVGSPSYGDGPMIEGHPFKEKPILVLRKYWPQIKTWLINTRRDPMCWGWEIAQIAQTLIIDSKDIIPPNISAELVMGPAISMSKIDPWKVR